MILGEVFRVSFDAIVNNRLRSALTMLGIIIGIAAVLTMIALGEGAQRTVEERIRGLGTNVLTVRSGRMLAGGVDRGGERLTIDDAEALRDSGRLLLSVTPTMQQPYQVGFAASNARLSVTGTWNSYFDLNDCAVAQGRVYADAEDRGRRRVAVLGALVGERLGLESTALLLGQTISIRGISFEVIGILREKGSQGFQNPDEAIYIPLNTARFRIMGSDRLQAISFKAAAAEQIDAAMAEADEILRREHRIQPGEEADFDIRDMTSLLSTFQETTRTFTFLLAGIASISLLVGGIGIMNIMLVSVTERTREIGVRKAVGARRRDILMQFLIESLVLCLSGGGIGLGLGLAGSVVLERFAGWTMDISPGAVVLAIGFSAAVGVFFGIWPARRAASLDPIASLRYE